MWPHFVQKVRVWPFFGPSKTGFGALILPPQWRQLSPWEIMGVSPCGIFANPNKNEFFAKNILTDGDRATAVLLQKIALQFLDQKFLASTAQPAR
jgi:hypothetical protein